MDLESLERALAHVSLFAHLRTDELARVARRFELVELGPGEARDLGGEGGGRRLVVLVAGRAELELEPEGNTVRTLLEPGDRFGDVAMVSGRWHPFRVRARRRSTLALLAPEGLDRLLADFPAVALPLAAELASELRLRNDALRQLLELQAEGLPPDQLEQAVAGRRRAFRRRRAPVVRLSPQALFRWLVVQRGEDPPFWILAGFLAALALARLTVYLILRFHLEAQLFALVRGADPNPLHVHHFNYGLVLVGCAGLAALHPFGRRALRTLAFAFGAGCGLVLDEFSLIWRLNPEYAGATSLVASAVAAALLAQLVYFRRYWRALLGRAWQALRGWR